MKLTDDMKTIVQNAPYLTLVTMNQDGTPHPIIVGGKEEIDHNVLIGIYKMDTTQENLLMNPRAWITAATIEDGPRGFRFEGTARVKNDKVVFIPDRAEAMI